jgi:Caspase domain
LSKFAVVIGVDRTGDLPVLRDAASGAQKVAAWLLGEGFAVTRFIDKDGPVKVGAIFDAVEKICDKGVAELLVVYFSGHGYLNDGSEHWLLSGAPANPNEAVSLDENIQVARDCGILNVVFISDACRSTPQSLKADRVRGSLIFPNYGVARQARADIDRFFACLPGDPAYEVPVDKSSNNYKALYTSCLTAAYQDTPAELTVQVAGVEVLPNRRLKKFLPPLMEVTAASLQTTLFQKPDAITESEPEVYIAKVDRRTKVVASSPPVPPATEWAGPWAGSGPLITEVKSPLAALGYVVKMARNVWALLVASRWRRQARPPARVPQMPVPSLRDHADDLLAESLGIAVHRGEPSMPDGRLRPAISAAKPRSPIDQFVTHCGIVVSGVAVTEVRGVGCSVELLTRGDGREDALVRVTSETQDVEFTRTVLIRFADGAGAAVATLNGFLCNVIVDYDGGGGARTDGVVQVTYTPSRNNPRWGEFNEKRTQIESLRALVAGLARRGVFRIDKSQAKAFADHIRLYKSFDPTLGLYASYAYNDAGLGPKIESVAKYMRDDLEGATFYDVALLLRQANRERSRSLSPFCPMLSQGWSLMRVQSGFVPEAALEASAWRRASLWTTFEPRGMDILFAAYRRAGVP